MDIFKTISAKTLGAATAGALAVCAPALLLAPATPAAAQAASSQGNARNSAQNAARLDRAVRALRGITTLKADFTQTDRSGQAVTGELTLRNPGRIRFEYSEDVNMLIVSNGRSLAIADYDVQQLERYPISDTPLGALLDPERDLARYGTIVPTNSPQVISVAVADPNKPEFPELTLIFVEKASAPGGLELSAWVALDSQNVRTTVRLSNHRYGMTVPDSAFTYRDPRGSSRRPR